MQMPITVVLCPFITIPGDMERRCQLDGFIVCLHVISITSLHPLSPFIFLILIFIRILIFPIKLPLFNPILTY